MNNTFSKNIIIIGSSAGGPRILEKIFKKLPRLNAAIIIVQHMPDLLNESLRRELAKYTAMSLVIAKAGHPLHDGTVYIAPSKQHLTLLNNHIIQLSDGPLVNFVKPSIDVTMQSLKHIDGYTYMGIILTGMGKDGAEGICYMKTIGGITIAQNKFSCPLPYMPEAAIKTGAIDLILLPNMIQEKLIHDFGQPASSDGPLVK